MEDQHNMADGGSVACLEAFNMLGLLQLLLLKNIEKDEVENRDVNQWHHCVMGARRLYKEV